MERKLGAEIASTFGARLRRTYDQDERQMPPEIAAVLERLKQAERCRHADVAAPELSRPELSRAVSSLGLADRSLDDEGTTYFTVTAPAATR